MIVQVGAELDKTAFEIALMKDQTPMSDPENYNELLFSSPLFHIYENHFYDYKNKKAIPVEKVNLKKTILEAYQEINARFGTRENRFLEWHQNENIQFLKEAICNLFYPEDVE